MKLLLSAMIVCFGLNAQAGAYSIYEGQTDQGVRFQVTSEAPVVDGDTIKFLNVQIEVNGRSSALSGSKLLWPILNQVCDKTEFKHLYTVSRHAGFFESSIQIEQSGFNKGRGQVVLQNMFCMKQAY